MRFRESRNELLPLPVLRERVGVRAPHLKSHIPNPKERPSPFPLPAYRERVPGPRPACALLVVGLLVALTGCGSAPVGRSVVTELSTNATADDLDFWHTLQNRPVTTNDDACHGLLLYLDCADPSTSYEARLGAL